jgi:enoyl-CoA hydratase/carnithine racemase
MPVEEITAVVLMAEGKHFSMGADIHEISQCVFIADFR